MKALAELEPDLGTDMPSDPQEAALYERWKEQKQLFNPEQSDDHFERVYTEPDYFKQISKSSVIQDAAKVNKMPDQVAIGAANRAFVAHTLGVESDFLNGSYPFYRDGYAQKYFGKTTVTDGEFYNLVKGQMETRKKAREAAANIPMDMVSSIFEDVANGTTRTSAEFVQNWKTQHADIFRPEYEQPLLAVAQQSFDENNDWIRKYAPQAKTIFESLSQQTGAKPKQEGTPDAAKVADALLSMPREDRFKAYEVASLHAAKTGDPKGFFQQLGESLTRGITETTGQVDLMAQEQALQAQIEGLNNTSSANVERTPSFRTYTAPQNPEERAKLATAAQNQLDRLAIVRELRQVATGQIDPIKNIAKGFWGDVEGGLYSAANSLPLMAAIAVPYVGVPASIAAYTGQEYDRIRLKYPDLPMEQAQTMSLVSGGVQAALDKLQVEAVFGKLPVTGKLLEEFSKPGRAWLPRVALASGLNFTEQMGQEMLQNATPMLVDATAKTLGADMPQFNWDEQLKGLKDSVPQTFFALLPYWLLGTGGISIRELKRGEQFRQNKISLENLGFKSDVAENLSNQPTPEKFDAAYKEAWTDLPESTKQKLIKRTDSTMRISQEFQSSDATPTLEKIGDNWSVKDESGKEIFNTPDEQSALAAYTEAGNAARETNRLAVQEMISFYQQVAAQQGRDVKFDVSESPKTVQDAISSGEVSIEQMRDRMRIEGITDDPSEVSIGGQVKVDELRKGVYQTTVKLFHGANPATVIEENIEGYTREALSRGDITMNFLKSQVQAYEQASGESLLTGTDQSVIEAVSTLGNAYFAGKVKDRQLPGTLQKFFRQLAIYFKQIFGRALKLKQAFAEGKLSSDFESLLAESVGIPIDQQIENHRLKLQQELLSENQKSNVPEGGQTFSIATKEQIARIDAALEKLNKAPDERVKIYERASQRLSNLLNKNRDIIDQMRIEGASREKISRIKLIQGIGELDAILSVLPPAVRGKIGGYTVLANVGTGEKALGNFFVNRLDMIDRELERTLKKEYDSKLQRLFERVKPLKDEAGKKRVGKAGAEIHALFNTLKEAVNWDSTQADAYIANLENKLDSGELTPEEEVQTRLELGLVPLVADWKNADSARRSVALENATRIFEKGYYEYRNKVYAEKERKEFIRQKLKQDTGKSGDKNERDARMLADNGFTGKWKDFLLGLLSFEQAMHWTFGQDSKEAARIVDMERNAAYQKDDSIQSKVDGLEELFTSLAGSRYKGEQLRWDMSQKSIEAGGIKLSELEAITATLMWRQEDGRRHMEGNFDESGKPISPWHYGQDFIDQVESQLSDNARAVRNFLSDEYSKEYDQLNKVYRGLNGIDLPKHKDYSPLTVVPQQAKGSQTLDPVTGNTFSAGSTTPGGLRTRGTSVAEPDFKDALQVYIAHTKQMEHWRAYAPMVSEAGAILRNRELGNSMQAKSGDQGLKVIRGWLDLFSQGGTRDAAAHLAINQAIGNMTNRAASVALVGRLGTLAVQATQLGASLAEMPVGSYLVRLGKLFSGQLGWSEAFKSEYVQRRLGEMPPIVRQAVEGLKSEKPNLLKHAVAKLGTLISGTDALFTAGTYAMVYDYQLSQAGKIGLSGEEAKAYATDKANKAVDRLAQPTRPGTRSYFENISTNPFTKLAWAFSSESRKNLMLAVYALAKRPVEEKLRTVAFAFLIEGAMSAIIRNAWRDARNKDDDEYFDEKNWDLKRLALSTLTSPIQGLPVVGDMIQAGAFKAAGISAPDGNLLSIGNNEMKAFKNLPDLLTGNLEGDQAMKDVEAMLTFAGRFNSDIAAAASLSHLAKDVFGVTENVMNNEKQ